MRKTSETDQEHTKQKLAPYRRIQPVIFLSDSLSSSQMLSLLLFVIFLLWVWWKAEVLFQTAVVVVYAVREQNNGPSREGGHVVMTGDLNCCFQSNKVTVQQCNTEMLPTGSIEMQKS